MKAENVSANLCLHKGAVRIPRGELLSIVTPPRTLTHKPVAHSAFIDYIETRLADHGIEITKCDLAVQNDGMKLFGTLVLQRHVDDFALALGLRAANDKSMAMELVAGCNVFCCDNMSLSGEAEVLWKKHTSGLDARTAIFGGVDRAIGKFTLLQNRIKILKTNAITDTEAKATIFDALAKGVITQNQVLPVGKEYFEPRHREFEPRNQWSLHNAFTEVFKTLRPNLALESAQSLGTLFHI